MRLIPLGSGSRGNATFVEFGNTRLLVDAGLSARQLTLRLESQGLAPASIDGILLSHEHDDHVRGAERFSMQHRVPLFCAIETLEAMDRSRVHFADWQPLRPAELTELGDVRVEYEIIPEWGMDEAHLWAGNDPLDIPADADHDQFPYMIVFDSPENSWVVIVPGGLVNNPDGLMYLAAHAAGCENQ